MKHIQKQKKLRWFFVLTLFLAGILSCLQLSINDNALDLLPGEAVRGDIRLLQKMGMVDRLFITLSVSDSLWQADREAAGNILRQSVEKLGDKLEESGQFAFVLARLPKGYEFSLFSNLRASLPLLFGPEELQTLEGRVQEEGVEATLQQAFALLNSPAGIGLKKQIQADPLGLVPLVLQKLTYLRSGFSLNLDDGFFISKDGRHCMIVAESLLSLTDSNGASSIRQVVQAAYDNSLQEGIEARIIGSLPHTLANKRIIERDLRVLLPAATLLLCLLLAVTLRNIRAFLVLGIPFLAAPPAIGLTSRIYGDLSGLALGFGIVLLGIAVDFSIHLYLALTRGEGSREELLGRIKQPILFATLTTSAVFLVLLFSEVPSHRQMATLALFGVLLAVLFAWLLVPTVVSPRQSDVSCCVSQEPVLHKSSKYSRLVLGAWLFLLVAGMVSWPRLHYTGDLRVLDVPDEKVKADSRHFARIWGESGDQAFIVVEGKTLGQLLDLNSEVYRWLKNNKIENFQSFAPILPGPSIQQENKKKWDEFWTTHRLDFEEKLREKGVALGFTETAFDPFFNWLDGPVAPLDPENLFSGSLQPLFLSMLKIPGRDEQEGDDFLAMTTVSIDEKMLPLLLTLETSPALQSGALKGEISILSNSKWNVEVERLLRHDIISLSLLAGGIIVLLVGVQFRNVTSVLAVLAPVFSALSAMSLFCFLTNGQLNMMHLIMGIMVIGLSVDYGIFIVCSNRSQQREVGRSSTMAVSICAASSLIGFGVLAFAVHPALHALGITVLVGIGVAWPTSLFVSPLLLMAGKAQEG